MTEPTLSRSRSTAIMRMSITPPRPARAPQSRGKRDRDGVRRRGQGIERRAEGPPVPQFRFTFTTSQFEKIVPWLMLNRRVWTFSSTRQLLLL
jgi:hypothetical protein